MVTEFNPAAVEEFDGVFGGQLTRFPKVCNIHKRGRFLDQATTTYFHTLCIVALYGVSALPKTLEQTQAEGHSAGR